LDGSHQEQGPCWRGPFAGHGQHGVGACRALFVEAEVLAAHCLLNQVQTSWHHARTCPLNRQGTAAAAHPHACFSNSYSSTAPCTPLQHLWGSKTHTQACLHTRAHTRTHVHAHTRTHACARAHTYTQTRAYTHRRAHTHIHIHTHKHTGTHARVHKHTHTRVQARTHTYTHTCICTHTLSA
jgi:hypothetical protein